jgi:hypothetical protein
MATPIANVNMNSHKLTGLSNGTLTNDAAAFGQIPTTLPPTGSAGGDLTGTYPNPTLTGTSNVNTVIRANSLDQMASPQANMNMNNKKLTNMADGTLASDAANFGQIPTTLPPSGTASGDLAGTYPSPTLSGTTNVNSVVRANRLDQMAAPQASVNMSSQKLINVANGVLATDAAAFGQVPTTLPPSGSAGGNLSGTYPNPVVSKINGIAASGTPAYGQALVANTSSASTWQITPGLMSSTGVVSGGTMSINVGNPSAFDIVATMGYVADYTTNPSSPTIVQVTIPAQTVVISGANANRGTNWWVADSTGTISSIGSNPPTPAQRRQYLLLGATANVVPTGVIVAIAGSPTNTVQTHNQLFDLLYGIGPFSISGNTISPNGTNLSFNKAAGVGFFPNFNSASNPNNPHTVTSAAETVATFRYATQLSGSTSGSFLTIMTPGVYDVGGTVTAISGGTGTSTIQRVYLFGTGGPPYQLVVQYGQNLYSSLSAAASSIGTSNFVPNPDFTGVGTLIGWIIMTKGATDLSNPAQATFIPAAKFARP